MSSFPVEPVLVWGCFSSPAVTGLWEKERAFCVRSCAAGSGMSAPALLAQFSACCCPEGCAKLQGLLFFSPLYYFIIPPGVCNNLHIYSHAVSAHLTYTSSESCSPCKRSGWSPTRRTTFCIFKNATGSEFASTCQGWLSASERRAGSRGLALSPSICAMSSAPRWPVVTCFSGGTCGCYVMLVYFYFELT